MSDEGASVERVEGACRNLYLRRISQTGWVLFSAWAIVLSVWGMVQPEPYSKGWRLVVELMFLGRLMSIVDGVKLGFSSTYLLFQTGIQDVILLLIFYPIVVTAYEGAKRRGFIGRRIDSVRKAAERHKSRVEPLGAIGLWLFVFFPFWSTGVLVGGVVGYLIGMRARVIFLSVISGHVISVVLLVFFFDAMRRVSESISSGFVNYLPWITLAILLSVFLLLRLRPNKGDSSPPRS